MTTPPLISEILELPGKDFQQREVVRLLHVGPDSHAYFSNACVASLMTCPLLLRESGAPPIAHMQERPQIVPRGFGGFTSARTHLRQFPTAPDAWPLSLEWSLHCRGGSGVLTNGQRRWTVAVGGDSTVEVAWPSDTGMSAVLTGAHGTQDNLYEWTAPFTGFPHDAASTALLRSSGVVELLRRSGFLDAALDQDPLVSFSAVVAALYRDTVRNG